MSGQLTLSEIHARLQQELDVLRPGLTLAELVQRVENEESDVVLEDEEMEVEADEEEEEDMSTLSEGIKFLNDLHDQLGQPAARGRSKGGRSRKSGADKIRDAAARELSRSTVKVNAAATALGLGDCRIARVIIGRRPTLNSLELYAADGTKRKPRLMTYHITWVAANGKVPAGPRGVRLEYSHRCGQGACIEPRHGLFQSHDENIARCRTAAQAASSCQCTPPCIFP